MLFEGCEESGSRDLPYYMDKLSARIGEPDLICCLDAGCGNFEQLWLTTSLRGNVAVNLTVEVMAEGAHSGTSSGIVPSSFRICRELLSRIEDERTGLVVPQELYVEVPPSRLQQTEVAAEILGDVIVRQFPFVEGAHPVAKDAPVSEHVLARTWRPALSITGCDGLPPTRIAGNVSAPVLRTHAPTHARGHQMYHTDMHAHAVSAAGDAALDEAEDVHAAASPPRRHASRAEPRAHPDERPAAGRSHHA